MSWSELLGYLFLLKGGLASVAVVIGAYRSVTPFGGWIPARLNERNHRPYTFLALVAITGLGIGLLLAGYIDVLTVGGQSLQRKLDQLSELAVPDCRNRVQLTIDGRESISVEKAGCFLVGPPPGQDGATINRIECDAGTQFILQTDVPERPTTVHAWSASQFTLNHVEDVLWIFCMEDDKPVVISRSSAPVR